MKVEFATVSQETVIVCLTRGPRILAAEWVAACERQSELWLTWRFWIRRASELSWPRFVGAYLTLAKAGTRWALLAALGALLIIGGGLRFAWHWINTRIDPVGEETYLREKRIRLTDLAVPEDPIVKGRVKRRECNQRAFNRP